MTSSEREQNTATVLVSLGQLRPNATPAERAAAVNALTDAQINANADRLLALLGHPDYQQPAAA